MNTFLQLDYAYSYIYTYSYIQKKFRRYNEHKKIIQKVFDSVEESLVSDIVLQSLVSQLCRLSDPTMSYQIFMSTCQIFIDLVLIHVSILCSKIFTLHIFLNCSIFINASGLKLFSFNILKKSQGFFFETQPSACQISSHG